MTRISNFLPPRESFAHIMFFLSGMSKRQLYRSFHKTVTNKHHQLVANGILLALALLISINKITGFNPDQYLELIITATAIKWLKTASIWVVVYASGVRIVTHILDAFPPLEKIAQEPERISECILNINLEIKRHLSEIETDAYEAARSFTKSHNFDVNVAHIVGSLAAHLKQAFSHLKIRNRDIFISIYQMKNFDRNPSAAGALEYLTHWDPQRDTVFSKLVEIDGGKFKGYECVKAIVENSASVILLDCSKYKKTKNKRGDIKHYVGMQLQHGDTPLGFMNIEFHNKPFFSDEAQMLEFVEKEILAFKYLVEYQFLKKRFFSVVSQQLITEPT